MYLGFVAVALSLIISGHRGEAAPVGDAASVVNVPYTDPLIYYHGRWDAAPATWWYVCCYGPYYSSCLFMLLCSRASSGFKLHVSNLKSLSLTLGPNTTAPLTSLGVSVDYQPFVTVNVSEGANEIDVTGANPSSSLVRFNAEEWQDNRMNLESIQLNSVSYRCLHSPLTPCILLGRKATAIRASASRLPIHRRLTLRWPIPPNGCRPGLELLDG